MVSNVLKLKGLSKFIFHRENEINRFIHRSMYSYWIQIKWICFEIRIWFEKCIETIGNDIAEHKINFKRNKTSITLQKAKAKIM